MARPRRVRVSKRAAKRAAKALVDRAGPHFTITTGSSATDVTFTSRFESRQIVIESLDEGLTWHTADTVEPAANLNGELVIGSTQWGVAPECMRPGSGTYRFEVTLRRATDDETAVWVAAHQQEQQRDLEELARAEEARRLAEEAEFERRKLEREKADVRARSLLLSHISPSQRRDLETRGGFWVTSQLKNRYWVTPRTAVRFDDRGVALQYYCIYPDGNLPADDNALARLLTLQCDEERFLRTANAGPPSEFHLRPPQPAGDIVIGQNLRFNVPGDMVWTPIQVGAPYLISANGVVRPLCG